MAIAPHIRVCGTAFQLWLVCCLCGFASLLQAATVLELSRAGGFSYELNPALEYLHDPTAQLELGAVRASSAFVRPATPLDAYGFASGALWLKAVVSNRDNPAADWMLVFDSPVLDQIDVWVEDLRLTGTPQLRHYVLGDQLPFDRRTLDMRKLNTELSLPAGGSWRIWLRVQSTSALRLRMELMSRSAAHRRNAHELFGLGLYYGIVAALVIYTAVLWFALRQRSFLLFVAHAVSFSALMLLLNGCAFAYFWPGRPELNNPLHAVLLALAVFSALAFAREVLGLRRSGRFWNGIFLGLGWLTLAMALLAVWVPEARAIAWLNLVLVVGVVLIALAALLLFGRGRDIGGFLVAWTLLLAGTWTAPAVSFGWIEQNLWTSYGAQFGSALELIVMAFFLAHRISRLRDEDQRKISEGAEQLERKVEERTHELSDALQRLDWANQHLKELSQRDGLTGLFDRRRLDLLIEQRFAESAERHLPLCLLMVDLDGFKLVNDQYGHRVGDDCLRALAARLRGAFAGTGEAVGRYGGEEFTVLLPGATLAAAYARAEAFRAEVEAMAVTTDSGPVRISLSIGLACVEPAAGTTSGALLQRADAALYAAKRQGRNRVATG